MLTAAIAHEPRAAEMSRRNVLAFGTSTTGAAITLTHRTAGWEPAGSLTRNVGEAWGYLYTMRDGTNGGQWFNSEAEARARFDRFNVTTGAR